MQNFLTALGAVYPLMALLAAGMLVRRLGLVTDSGLKEMNGLVYKLFFPAMMYANVMDSDFGGGVNTPLLLTAIGLILALFLTLMLLVPRLEPIENRRGVLVQGIFRSNFMVFGFAIVTSLYGSGALGSIVLMAAIVIPLMNALSIVALETFRGGKPDALRILRNVAKNPIIIGTLLAFVCRGLHIDPLPAATRSLAKVGTPFALVVIGASFRFANVTAYRKPLLWGVLGKLVLMPIVAMVICIALGFRNELLIALLAIFAGPCATASYAMAQQMGGDGDLAALLVVFTSAFCVVTFFLWIYAFKTLGLA